MSDPIAEDQRERMNVLARLLDDAFNGTSRPKMVGFVLLTYSFGEDIKGTGRVNYIGNGERGSVRIALTELLARWNAETEGKQ
jgi:hypothetical protein